MNISARLLRSVLSPKKSHFSYRPHPSAPRDMWLTLPTEIFTEILEKLRPDTSFGCRDFEFEFSEDGLTLDEFKTTMVNLSMVSHLFRQRAVPFVFESILFRGWQPRRAGRNDEDQDPRKLPGFIGLCEALSKGEDRACFLATYIKQCTFLHWDSRDQEGYNDFSPLNYSHLNEYSQALKLMPNLTSLHMKCTTINHSLLNTISNCTSLTHLFFYVCSFENVEETPSMMSMAHMEQLVRLENLESLECEGPHTELFAGTIARMKLRDLIVKQPGGLPEGGQMQWAHQLNKLSIMALEPGRLRAILEHTPYLSELVIRDCPIPDNAPRDFSLPTQALPYLRVLRCPPLLAPVLVPGRPVEELSLVGFQSGLPLADPGDWRQLTQDEMILLTKTTSSITKLAIPIRVFLTLPGGLPQCFPYVRDLLLLASNHNYEWRLNRASRMASAEEALAQLLANYSKLGICLSVKTLRLDARFHLKTAWGRNLPKQLDLIQTLHQYLFPNITTASITKIIQWNLTSVQPLADENAISRSPQMLSGSTWLPHPSPFFREQLRSEMMISTESCVDFNGCYAGAFGNRWEGST